MFKTSIFFRYLKKSKPLIFTVANKFYILTQIVFFPLKEF